MSGEGLTSSLRKADLAALDWQPFRDGVEAAWLYGNGAHGPAAAYLRYQPGARIPRHWHAGYENVIVLDGSQSDHKGRYAAGSLAINPPGSSHEVWSEEGCIVLVIWERPVIIDTAPES